jgi:predicted DNA-binding transcriptional regulator AlpA
MKMVRDNVTNQAAVPMEPLMTINDVAKLLKVVPRTIARLWERGQLPRPLKLGGSNRWRPQDIAAAIDRLGVRGDKKRAFVSEDK